MSLHHRRVAQLQTALHAAIPRVIDEVIDAAPEDTGDEGQRDALERAINARIAEVTGETKRLIRIEEESLTLDLRKIRQDFSAAPLQNN